MHVLLKKLFIFTIKLRVRTINKFTKKNYLSDCKQIAKILELIWLKQIYRFFSKHNSLN